MSDIKFACPHCRQHIQCDAKHVGRTIACPNCKANLRIPKDIPAPPKLAEAELLSLPLGKTQPIQPKDPKSGAPTQTAPQLKATQKISQTKPAVKPAAQHGPTAVPKPMPARADAASKTKNAARAQSAKPAKPNSLASKPDSQVQVSAKPASSQLKEKEKSVSERTRVSQPQPAKKKPETSPVRCICPVCQSELRVATNQAESDKTQPPRPAELVRKGTIDRTASTTPSRPQSKSDPATGAPGSASVKVNQAQLARPGGGAKPRLDYILSGKTPPSTAYPSPQTGKQKAAPKKKSDLAANEQ